MKLSQKENFKILSNAPLTFMFQNTKLSIKKKKKKKKKRKKERKKKKPTLIFPFFGSVGIGQTNIFF